MPRKSALSRQSLEFLNQPNVDAGQGVLMMFAQVAQADLYEPLYREQMGLLQGDDDNNGTPLAV